MPFQKPRILTDSEENTVRGKMLVGHASIEQQFQLIGHLDLLVDKYKSALLTLQGCFPDKVFVYGAYGDRWSENEPATDEFEVIDFKELLGES